MSLLDDYYEKEKNRPSDINEHFETIKKYASDSESIVEMGVRYIVSTWALLAGYPKEMISIDINHPSTYGGNLEEVYKACEEVGIDFKFIEGSTLDISIEEVDLLFIDTIHTFQQLSTELRLHGNKAKKYIIMHDTQYFAKELIPAIDEFLNKNAHWVKEVVNEFNNGLTVLKRNL